MSENNINVFNDQHGESSFEAAQDLQDVEKVFEERCKTGYSGYKALAELEFKAFAKFYAQRCGVDINKKVRQ